MKIKFLFLTALILKTNSLSATELGSRNNPVKIAIMPLGHGAKALNNSKNIASCLEETSKIFTTFQLQSSYSAVGEGMKSYKIDLAFGDIMSYFIAKSKYDAEAILQVFRDDKTSYQSAIFVRADSSIRQLRDLNNKKFAFKNLSSASSYIFPSILMKKQNYKFHTEIQTGSLEASFSYLLNGKVDATAAFYNIPLDDGTINDARATLLSTFPNIEKETRILWISSYIPNEPVYVRKGLPESLKGKLSSAIQECIEKYPHNVNHIEKLIPITDEQKTYETFFKEVEESELKIKQIFEN